MIRTWKRMDFFIQAVLILAGFVFAFIRGFAGEEVLFAYIIVGAWQLMSCLINALWKKGQWKVSDRKAYLFFVFIILGSGSIIYITADMTSDKADNLIITYLIGLLILTPLMALWYLSICYREWQLIRTKELMHFK